MTIPRTADEDERALEEAGGHISQRELFALPLDDREDRDGGADVRDDEQQLEQGAEEDPVVLPGTRDVAGRSSRTGWNRISAGIDVTKVMR